MARGYWVFAAEQVDGYTPATALPPNPIQRIAAAEAFFAATGARVIVGGTQACYRPSTDTIHMPDEARFLGNDGRTRTDAWYRVLAHEHGHFTSAPQRCNRQLGKRFGDDQYAMEECIALSGQSGCGLSGQSGATRKFSDAGVETFVLAVKRGPRAGPSSLRSAFF